MQSLAEQQIDDLDKESNDSQAESIALLSKQFNHVLKRFGKKSSNKSGGTSTPKQFRTLSNKKDVEEPASSTLQKERTFRHRECEGYGHFQAKCPNFLKNRIEAMSYWQYF